MLVSRKEGLFFCFRREEVFFCSDKTRFCFKKKKKHNSFLVSRKERLSFLVLLFKQRRADQVLFQEKEETQSVCFRKPGFVSRKRRNTKCLFQKTRFCFTKNWVLFKKKKGCLFQEPLKEEKNRCLCLSKKKNRCSFLLLCSRRKNQKKRRKEQVFFCSRKEGRTRRKEEPEEKPETRRKEEPEEKPGVVRKNHVVSC